MTFVDTNIFIRFLTRDDPDRAEACALFLKALGEGTQTATTTDVIVAEIVYVLSSPRWFSLPRSEISALLEPIISLTGLRITGKERVRRALEIYAAHPSLDFEDALIVAQVEGSDTPHVLSYDRGFDPVNGIDRHEP